MPSVVEYPVLMARAVYTYDEKYKRESDEQHKAESIDICREFCFLSPSESTIYYGHLLTALLRMSHILLVSEQQL